MISVRCPICEKELKTNGGPKPAFAPFCSDRCKLIDLGRWLGGSYRVAAEEEEEDGSTLDADNP